MSTAHILSGRDSADALLATLREQVKKLDPKLVVVQVGEDPASASYIKQKLKSCEAVGMRSEHIHLPADIEREELLETIDTLNNDADVTGFIVQLPLPKHLQGSVSEVIDRIRPDKDVDGFGVLNTGRLFLDAGAAPLLPATPSGVMLMLKHYNIDVAGKHAVILGRSNIVGKPMALLLLQAGATVTICHSKTQNLSQHTKMADILVAAIGKAKFVTTDMLKPGAIVIDVGMNRLDGKLCGDTDYDALLPIVSAITPVPGGVGPMTVAALINNCVRAKELQLAAT